MKRDTMAALRAEVLARDEWRCLAPVLDPEADPCRGTFGDLLVPGNWGYIRGLTLEHVHEQPGMRRVHQVDHCLTLCHHHNVNGWASSHREQENAYLDRLYGTSRRIAR